MLAADATDVIPWWGWVLVWAVLALAALALGVLAAWRLFRKGAAVLTEAATAAARAGELLAQVDRLPREPRPGPAALEDPAVLRRARLADLRRRRKVRAVAVQARRERTRAGASATTTTPASARQAGGRAYDHTT